MKMYLLRFCENKLAVNFMTTKVIVIEHTNSSECL